MSDSTFGSAAASLTHNLDALRDTLDFVITVSAGVALAATAQHTKIVETYGDLISEENNCKTYRLPSEYVKNIERHRRRMTRAGSARELLSRNFLVSFVSEFDAFIGQLARSLYQACPELLNNSERTLTYQDLKNFDSLVDAQNSLVDQEVDSLLRCSHQEQFSWFEKKLKIPLKKELDRWACFIELTERRNLFVHCDGIVSAQYLKVCGDHGYNISNITLGSKLQASRQYLIDAYKCLFEFGVKLSQVVWRKLLPDDLPKADKALSDICYELLVEEKHDLSSRLLEFAVHTLKKHSSESWRRIFVMNLAQARKFNPKSLDIKFLDQEDWSAASDDFHICLAVLRDDFVGAANLMRRIGKAGVVPEAHYIDWPVFRVFRASQEFKSAFVDVFGKEPQEIAEVATVRPSAPPSEDGESSRGFIDWGKPQGAN